MWWATTSCSSRAMRARSPRAVWSTSVSADDLARRAVLFRLAACLHGDATEGGRGPSAASTTVRVADSDEEGLGPVSARTRNGAARPIAKDCEEPRVARRPNPEKGDQQRGERWQRSRSGNLPATRRSPGRREGQRSRRPRSLGARCSPGQGAQEPSADSTSNCADRSADEHLDQPEDSERKSEHAKRARRGRQRPGLVGPPAVPAPTRLIAPLSLLTGRPASLSAGISPA